MTDLCFTPAAKLARLLRARKLSASELMQAFIAQIERVNPKVNAIVTFLPERALKAAKEYVAIVTRVRKHRGRAVRRAA